MSTRLRRVALVGAVLIALSATTAYGNGMSSPRTDPVLASFGATMATGPQTFCTGVDRNYVEPIHNSPALCTPRTRGSMACSRCTGGFWST
jgi:hypothetical protein